MLRHQAGHGPEGDAMKPSFTVRVAGHHCWADHLRSFSDAKREQAVANKTTGMRHAIYVVTASGIAKEVCK